MKLEVNEDRVVELKEVFDNLRLVTEEGNVIEVCMRDNTFEMCVKPYGQVGVWYRVNMEKLNVEKL